MTPKKNQIWLLHADPFAATPTPGARVKVLRSITDSNKERVFVEVVEGTHACEVGERYYAQARDLMPPQHYEDELALHQREVAALAASRVERAALWRAITNAKVPRVSTVNYEAELRLSVRGDTPEELKESVTALIKVMQEFVG